MGTPGGIESEEQCPSLEHIEITVPRPDSPWIAPTSESDLCPWQEYVHRMAERHHASVTEKLDSHSCEITFDLPSLLIPPPATAPPLPPPMDEQQLDEDDSMDTGAVETLPLPKDDMQQDLGEESSTIDDEHSAQASDDGDG